MLGRLSHLASLATLVASAAAASAHGEEGPGMRIDFANEAEAAQWRAVNDDVMGGKSSGGPVWDGEHLTFRGVINTNGGGFSSLRAPMADGRLSEASALRLRIRSDGRAYRLLLRTDVTRWGMPVAFQAPLPDVTPGEWTDVEVPLTGLESSFHGRPVEAQFDKADVRSIGIILADGKDGPFEMSIASIEAIENIRAGS